MFLNLNLDKLDLDNATDVEMLDQRKLEMEILLLTYGFGENGISVIQASAYEALNVSAHTIMFSRRSIKPQLTLRCNYVVDQFLGQKTLVSESAPAIEFTANFIAFLFYIVITLSPGCF